MATKKHKIVGTAMWAKVFDHNGETKDWQGNFHPFGKKFKIDVILDKENKAIYKTSGTAGKGKFNDDGEFIASFYRKEVVKDKEGKLLDWACGVPNVVNADGTKFEEPMFGEPIIPNGSKVEVEFSVYTTSMTPGTRLEKVTVLELAELPEREAPKAEGVAPIKGVAISTEVPF